MQLQFESMEWLTAYTDRLWIPVLAIAGAVIARIAIRRYCRRRAGRQQSELYSRLIANMEAATTPLLIFAALYVVAFTLPLQPDVIDWIQRAIGILAIVMFVPAASRIVSTLLEISAAQKESFRRYVQPLRTLFSATFVLIGVALAFRIIDVDLSQEGAIFVRVAGIALGAYIAVKIVHLAVMRLEGLVYEKDPGLASETEKRLKTLSRIINSAALITIASVAIMMVLSEFGLDITPIITGAGIAGLAVGFGAQNLVRDVISGFFMIMENQVRVGDVAVINGTGGMVEAINLRTIVLRDLHGTVHVFPNGAITAVSNMTKEWSRSVIDVGVGYKENVDHVMKTLEEVGREIMEDEKFRPAILEPLEIAGVDKLENSQVVIRIMIKTLPLKQWFVGRELRRRIKNKFDGAGIEIAIPRMSVYFAETSKPFEVSMKQAGKMEESEGRPTPSAS